MRKLTTFAIFAAISAAMMTAATAAPSFKKAWSADVGRIETMTADGHNIYFTTDAKVGLIDDRTGKVIWSHNYGALYWRPAVSYGAGVVCVDASGSMIFAYDAATGKKLWSRPVTSDYTHPLTVNGGAVICQLNRDTMGALDLKTHQTLWKLSLSPGGSGDAFNIDNPPLMAPDGHLVFGVSDHPDADDAPRVVQVFCLTQAGKVVWRKKFPQDGAAWVEKIAVDNGTVILSMRRERLIALDAANGNVEWDRKAPSDGFDIHSGNIVAVGNGAAYGYDFGSGKPLWQNRLTTDRTVDLSGPVSIASSTLAFTGSAIGSETIELGDGSPTRADLPAAHLTGPAEAHGDGFLVSGQSSLYYFVPGGGLTLPSDATARKTLAVQLVGKFDKLTDDEKFELAHLGGDAIDPVLKLVKARADKQEAPNGSMDDRGSFQDALQMLTRLMRPEYTQPVMDVTTSLTANTDPLGAYADLLRLLAAKGDDKLTTPLFLKVAQAGAVPGLSGPFEAAMSVLKHSTDPDVVEYLMSHVKDDGGPVRETAYRCLALTGGDAGVETVRSIRRSMPALDDTKRAVLAAAVECHYHFKDTNPMPVSITLPAGLDVFDMPSFSYITVHESGLKPDYEAHLLTFVAPSTYFDGAAYYPDDLEGPILWNADETEAKVGLKIFYDPKTPDSYDVTLRKFGTDWLPVDYVELEAS